MVHWIYFIVCLNCFIEEVCTNRVIFLFLTFNFSPNKFLHILLYYTYLQCVPKIFIYFVLTKQYIT